MTRTPILAAVLTVIAAGGVAVATDRSSSPSVSLVTAAQEAGEAEEDDDETDESTTTTVVEVPSTTTSITLVPDTTTTTEAPTTTTTAAPPPPTTTTAPPPAVGPLVLRCAGDGGGAKHGDAEYGGSITCSIEGKHERAGKLTLSRDGVVIAETRDMSVDTYTDTEVRPGQTYSYQAHTYAEDGTPLQASDAARATAPGSAGGDTYDGPMVMRCAGSKTKTDDGPGVHCEWKGVPDGATSLTLSRDGEVIVRKDDPTKTSWWDGDVERGRTYTYVLRAHAADGSVIAETDPVAATAGGGA